MKKILFAMFAISILNADIVCSTAPDGAVICSDGDGSTIIITGGNNGRT